jgi:hypothetical protein
MEGLGGVILRSSLVAGEDLLRVTLRERDVRLVAVENTRWLGVGG